MGKWKKHILIVFFAVLLNLVGRFTALYLALPGYMNLLGTMLAAYLAGPVAGTLAAVLSCAVSSVISPGDWYYLAADIAVAVATGLLGRQNRFFEKSHLIISATTFFALARTPILLGVNLIRNGGRSGFVFESESDDQLARLIADMINMAREERKKIGSASREVYESHFTHEIQENNVKEIVERWII
jgi:hypothetical protein